jgi:hypothetical protein
MLCRFKTFDHSKNDLVQAGTQYANFLIPMQKIDLTRPCDVCGKMIGGSFKYCPKCNIYDPIIFILGFIVLLQGKTKDRAS